MFLFVLSAWRDMALAQLKVTVTVCEGCWEQGKPAQRYAINFPGAPARRALDLCVDCAGPLEQFRPEEAHRQRRRVYSAEEIDVLRKRE